MSASAISPKYGFEEKHANGVVEFQLTPEHFKVGVGIALYTYIFVGVCSVVGVIVGSILAFGGVWWGMSAEMRKQKARAKQRSVIRVSQDELQLNDKKYLREHTLQVWAQSGQNEITTLQGTVRLHQAIAEQTAIGSAIGQLTQFCIGTGLCALVVSPLIGSCKSPHPPTAPMLTSAR